MHRRALAAATAAAALVLVTLAPPTGVATGADFADRSVPAPSAQVVHDWERIALRTVYTEGLTPIPVGSLYLAFTSVAMHNAVAKAHRVGASKQAAAAVAAHDVLAEYFPAFAANLATDLAASLGAIPAGADKTKGISVGRKAARRMIRDRADDGRGDPIVYDRVAAPGVWPSTTATFLAPWLGFVEPVVLTDPVQVDGPDSILSAAYALDFQEVKRVGVAGTTPHRTEEQTFLANFFNFNPPLVYSNAVLAALADETLSLRATSQLFARMHASMADSLIQCWRLKFDIGYWRPFQGIRQADIDDNPATVADPTWTSLVGNPPYPEYPSGHGCVTSATMETLRRTLGESTELTLQTAALGTRSYPTLSALEFDALNARIWGGVHFRDGMDDAYFLGRETARRVRHHLR